MKILNYSDLLAERENYVNKKIDSILTRLNTELFNQFVSSEQVPSVINLHQTFYFYNWAKSKIKSAIEERFSFNWKVDLQVVPGNEKETFHFYLKLENRESAYR